MAKKPDQISIDVFHKYGLSPSDVFEHQHFTIINRGGIEKIAAKAEISLKYTLEECTPHFAVVKAYATKKGAEIETFASALYGEKVQMQKNGKNKWVDSGTTGTLYIVEMAEKRAMSRAVLKIENLYQHGFFGEDESEEFKRPDAIEAPPAVKEVDEVFVEGQVVLQGIIKKLHEEGVLDKIKAIGFNKSVLVAKSRDELTEIKKNLDELKAKKQPANA